MLTEVNDAFLQMSGFTREEVLGKTWRELTPPEFHELSLRGLDELAKTGTISPCEKQYFRKDGSRWWGLFTARQLGNEAVEFVIDVTERKHAEAALRESEQRQATLAAELQHRVRNIMGDYSQYHDSHCL